MSQVWFEETLILLLECVRVCVLGGGAKAQASFMFGLNGDILC